MCVLVTTTVFQKGANIIIRYKSLRSGVCTSMDFMELVAHGARWWPRTTIMKMD